ncbi:MAG TPA: ABC transporter substrate-binding protein, partial [Chloroflexota bacterium]|nr:ABC transporter substrate-binding protein [Chloroflexota bacterium]
QQAQRQSQAPSAPKTLTIGVTSPVTAMAIFGNQTTAGGWLSTTEVHSDGLITSDVHTRTPIGRLAERVPSLDDGSIALLPDGRMRVTYTLRRGVTWQDQRPFTAQDLAFSYQLISDKGLPSPSQRDHIDRIESVEAPDDNTFVLNFKGPYYQGAALGVRSFWPLPEHILGPAYEKFQQDKDPAEVMNHPYWTTEYVHLGPFRLTSFDPQAVSFEAYSGYFLGRPKVDHVRIQLYTDTNTLYTGLLAGAVDLFPDLALSVSQGFELKERWESTGAGTVYVKPGITWFLAPQMRPSVQIEPTTMDVNVRAGLYQALDRDGLAEGLLNGHSELAAYSLLPSTDPHYESTRDSLRRYAYDPARARASLQTAGWTQGADGAFRHTSDGRPFRAAVWTTPGFERDVAAVADGWRRFGLQVDELVVPAAQVRNNEFRASYPGWDLSAQGSGDAILGRMLGPAAGTETGWVGNRGGYDDPRMRALVDGYRSSLTPASQIESMRAISDFVAAELLPLMPLYFQPEHLGVRQGVLALDDQDGGEEAAQMYGTFTRNAYLWDLQG